MLLKDYLKHKYIIQMAASFSKATVIKSTINLLYLLQQSYDATLNHNVKKMAFPGILA